VAVLRLKATQVVLQAAGGALEREQEYLERRMSAAEDVEDVETDGEQEINPKDHAAPLCQVKRHADAPGKAAAEDPGHRPFNFVQQPRSTPA